MRLLAFEAGAGGCSAAVFDGDRPPCLRRLEGPGQGDALIPLLDAVLAEEGVAKNALGALAVCVGPGGFTGIRVAVAAAKGLGLVLGLPAFPVTTLAATACAARGAAGSFPRLVAVDAGRGTIAVQPFGADLSPDGPMTVTTPGGLAGRPDPLRPLVFRDGLPPDLALHPPPLVVAVDARHVGRAALAAGGTPAPTFDLKPLYLRPADARPSAGRPLVDRGAL
ncbi:MAG: tRNA (adenosine(37)-N6)-threonylcarbamoyltransferase complex dimerization subunit type 1 TsaB [Geminicoccaceae bacterium]|nr:tRNA (adenosine(37)-N6)-threonylcarbamoyltransferase complex dimerization subunit type 1 TsaB [Geminicoccaceae bacterium]